MKKEIGALTTFVFILAVGLIYPITSALGNQEITNPEVSFNLFFFSIILVGSSVLTMALYFLQDLWKKDDRYGDGFGFFNIGESPSLKIFKGFTAPQLALYFYIGFAFLFLASELTNGGAGFTQYKTLPQSFSKVDQLLFSSTLIPFAEEMLNIATMGLLVLGLKFFSIKYDLKNRDYTTLYYAVIPLLMGVLAVVWHISAYSGSDYNLTVVFLFWWMKALVILFTGFVVVGIMIHHMNNFILEYVLLFTSDSILITYGSFLALLTAFTVWFYRGRLLGVKGGISR